jgi:membrane associated rhomboid family serine protease
LRLATMMHSIDTDHSSDSSDIFSPVNRRRSLHNNDHSNSLSTPEQDYSLPRLHDNSWIGARVSPIASFDQEDPDELATAPYRKALHDSLEASFVHVLPTERSSLLGNNKKHFDPRSNIHPLWDHKDSNNKNNYNSSNRRGILRRVFTRTNWGTLYWGNVVLAVSGGILGCISVHDIYLWYLMYRRGIEPMYSIAWTMPWLSPSIRTLTRFGAFMPSRLLFFESRGEYWRIGSSMFLSTSILEWLLIVWAWIALQQSTITPTTTSGSFSASLLWALLYIVSILTGQLWMTAFHKDDEIAGCVSWGTCGILCAMGVSRPERRFFFFCTVIALVVLELMQPTGSVFGAIGGSFFGWAFSGVGLWWTPNSSSKAQQQQDGKDGIAKSMHAARIRKSCLHWFSTIVLIILWVVPILFIVRGGETS